MSAYVIGEIEVTDPGVYADYRKQVPATIEKYGGRFAARGGKAQPPASRWSPRRARLERRHVAGGALRRAVMAVRLARWVEVALGAHAVARAAGAGLVNVEAVVAPRHQPADAGNHTPLVAELIEIHRAGGLAVL